MTRDLLIDRIAELQALAQAGLHFTKNPYDAERFQRIRDISAELMSERSGLSLDRVQNLFCCETGYQTPKLDTRAVVVENGKILLVRENTGKWSLPGGWCDVNQSIRSNTMKEAHEEAGIDVVCERIIALHDRNLHNTPPYAYGICKVFVLCRRTGGEFRKNIETVESAWFVPEDLPELAVEKNTPEQIRMCVDFSRNPDRPPEFD